MNDPVFDAGLVRSELQPRATDMPLRRSAAKGGPARADLSLAQDPIRETPPRLGPGVDRDVINIAFGLDAAYLAHAGVVVKSIVVNAPQARFLFLILHDDISAPARLEFERCAEGHRFLWLKVDEPGVLAMPSKRHISRAGYFRLMITELAPADIRRVLYLDADLVVTSDIRELYRTELGDCPIGAVSDVGMDALRFAERFALAPQRLGYFNSGVLVLDLDKLRMSGDFRKTLDLLETRMEDMEYGDQCALNVIFWQRWKQIDMLWNVQRRMLMPEEGKPCFANPSEMKIGYRPKIIHFTEYNKPWSTDAWHPLVWSYYQYLDRTPYGPRVRKSAQVTLLREIRRRVKTFINWRRLKGNMT